MSDNANHETMIIECVDKYEVSTYEDGSIKIIIIAPKRFANIWRVKLESLVLDNNDVIDC